MSAPTNQELIDRWREQDAPLLPLLHDFHDRDGYISEAAMRDVARGLRIPLADLFGTVTFYHHFAREPAQPQAAPRVCTARSARCAVATNCWPRSPIRGPRPCPAPDAATSRSRCCAATKFALARTSPACARARRHSRPQPRQHRRVRLSRHPRARSRIARGLSTHRRLRGVDPSRARNAPGRCAPTVIESQLAGRGGAGFPTGRKWKRVAEAAGDPKTIVCNADEGEPGCFKDRALMDHDPHAVLEGMAIAAYATGATRGFIYLRYEYPHTVAILERAIDEARAAGLLGSHILGSDFSFELVVRRGAGAYICGEETSLLNSLEGKHPFPRNRPPYPVTHGFEDLPTAVNNVETLAAAAQILRHGPEWYQGLGLGDHAGTKIISLSGDVQRPGNYEVPIGLPLRTLLYDWAGGPMQGRTIQAVTMAGLSGGFLAAMSWTKRRSTSPASAATGRSSARAASWSSTTARHGRGRAPGDDLLRPRIVRQVLPLSDRHPTSDRTADWRRPHRVRCLAGRSQRHRPYHEGGQRLRSRHGRTAGRREPDSLLPRQDT